MRFIIVVAISLLALPAFCATQAPPRTDMIKSHENELTAFVRHASSIIAFNQFSDIAGSIAAYWSGEPGLYISSATYWEKALRYEKVNFPLSSLAGVFVGSFIGLMLLAMFVLIALA